jgi:hypothetical protein
MSSSRVHAGDDGVLQFHGFDRLGYALGSSSSSGRGTPRFTSQKAAAPRADIAQHQKVAVPLPQHSPILGAACFFHTRVQFLRCMSSFSQP